MLTGHTFEGQCTARLRNLDTAEGGLPYKSSSSELVEPHIKPFKVRDEEAKCQQVFVRDCEH